MCGRYTLFTDAEIDDINSIIKEVNQKHNGAEYKTGEIFPTNNVPIISSSGVSLMTWGFPNFRKKGVIINARSETAIEKRTFKNLLCSSRCVIPSTGFYEWTQDGEKVKYLFKLQNQPVLYMAGLYNEYEGQQKFVILTTAANSSIDDVHNRMPLVLMKEKKDNWIDNTDFALEYLQTVPPMLERAKA